MTTRWPWSARSWRKTLRARPTSSASFCAAKRHRGQAMSEEAVAALPRHLSGTQKSAILMMLLGEDEGRGAVRQKVRPRGGLPQELLTTTNSDDDKVAVVRRFVAEDTARASNVVRQLLRSEAPQGASNE